MILDAHKNAHSCPQNCIKIEKLWSFHLHSSFFYINICICILVSFHFSFCFASWILKNALLSGFSWKTFEQANKNQYICMEMAHSGTFSLYTFLSPHQKKKEFPRKKPFSLYVSFHFSSFLFIFPFLHTQKRLTFRVIMTTQPVGKQISTANWCCIIPFMR